MKQKNLITNKKGFNSRDFLIALILFFVSVAVIFASITGISNEYETSILDSGIENRYNQLNNLTSISSDMFNVTSSGGGLSFLQGASELIFGATPKVILLILQSVGITAVMIANIFFDLQVPSEITIIIGGAISAIIMVSIVILIIRALLKSPI